MNINSELKEYIEKYVFPEYSKNEQAHNIEHIKYVINRSFKFADTVPNINYNIVYTIAAYHDIGHHIDSKKHEIISGEIMSKDENLKKFFSDEELKIIKEAIEDHRASSDHEPRSIYGKIVCDADKDNNIEISLLRAYEFTKRYFPDYTVEECYKNVFEQLQYKFGTQGKVKYWINSQKQQDFMKSMHELSQDENKFNSFLTKVIKKNEIKEIEDSEIR